MKYVFLWFWLPFYVVAQPNCQVYLSAGDTLQYKACRHVETIDENLYQFSKGFQVRMDEAIAICPRFAYAYREKSVAYLKSGDFLTWKPLIDKAVEHDPLVNLSYRGWCRYQFFRDYQGAIDDIDRLRTYIKTGNIGYGINGDYQLNIVKGLCYAGLGEYEKAIEIIDAQLRDSTHHIGQFDYYQLGVLYFLIDKHDLAMQALLRQEKEMQFAETSYYIGQIHKKAGRTSDYEQAKATALQRYDEKKIMLDPYTHHANKVFYLTMLMD